MVDNRDNFELASVDPASFSYDLLEDLFQRHNGPGRGTLVIGGIEVTKDFIRHSSNSGKTHSWEVWFEFTDPDGRLRRISGDSKYKTNRRNDAERNWGLPD